MQELAIGLGVAAGGILATVIFFFILLRSEGVRTDRATDRADALDKENHELAAGLEDAHEREQILDANNGQLLKELSDLKTSHQSTEAELASVKASRDDLVRLLQDHPGALPAAVHGALERLRAQVPASSEATPTGDPHGGEGRPVHEGDELEPPE